MPTENRSSNTDPRDVFIRLNPLGLGEAELRKDSTGFEDPRTHSDYLLFLAGYRETHPEPQPHPEPIAWMVGTAIWWTKEEAERDAAETGLPIVGLGPMTGAAPAEQHPGEPVAWRGLNELGEVVTEWIDGVPPSSMEDLCGNSARFASIEQAYTHADPGEVKRLRLERRRMDQALVACANERDTLRAQLAECEAMAAMIAEREWAEHAGTGPVSSKVEAAFTQLHNDLHEVGEKLAERDALLIDWYAANASGEVQVSDKAYALVTRTAALSASAELSALVEIDERAAFEAASEPDGANLDRNSDGEYVNPYVQSSWEGWSMRAALERKAY